MYRLKQKQSLSVITYDPLEVCGGVCICPLPGFSYFAVYGTFLGVNLWAVVCSPEPITVRSVRGAGLCKNVATSCQIVRTWEQQRRFEPGRRGQL